MSKWKDYVETIKLNISLDKVSKEDEYTVVRSKLVIELNEARQAYIDYKFYNQSFDKIKEELGDFMFYTGWLSLLSKDDQHTPDEYQEYLFDQVKEVDFSIDTIFDALNILALNMSDIKTRSHTLKMIMKGTAKLTDMLEINRTEILDMNLKKISDRRIKNESKYIGD